MLTLSILMDCSIKTELQLFAESIVNNTTPPVTIQDGYDALNVAYQVLDKLKVSSGLTV